MEIVVNVENNVSNGGKGVNATPTNLGGDESDDIGTVLGDDSHLVNSGGEDSDTDVVILSEPLGYTQENPIPVLSTSVDNLTNKSNPSVTALSSSEEPMEYGSSEEPSLEYGSSGWRWDGYVVETSVNFQASQAISTPTSKSSGSINFGAGVGSSYSGASSNNGSQYGSGGYISPSGRFTDDSEGLAAVDPSQSPSNR
ncbi:hypothetical protein FRX31_019263 [Thalictrum thalictroides]|uniref:Uncharacterized protein n=1 Tax=Thalictrum thalictroides TaxID=46969 RepID=A0A7J6W3R6_THATH|nr:hypothetical protein FRX31_019263 [Thalictrum thalictroides]